jgi:hypothetical protein
MLIVHKHQQNEQQKKTTTYGNPGPDLRQTQKSGSVKPVNGIPTLCLLIN